MNAFRLHVLAADHPFYDGECSSLVVPTIDGEYGVLAGHCNTICAIVPGTMHFSTPSGEMHVAAVASGIMKVAGNDVLVLVDSAERPEEIDENRARRKADEAREELLQKKSIEEHHFAQIRLARAINRLRVKDKYKD